MSPPGESEPTLFRKSALESVGGRNRLNSLSPLISPRMWIVTASLALLLAALVIWGFAGLIPRTVVGRGIFLRGERLDSVNAPVQGLIREFRKNSGDRVKAGECIAIMSATAHADDPLTPVLASADGTIVSLEAEAWDFVTAGQVIAIVAAGKDDPICIAFVPLAEGVRLSLGMRVRASFTHGDSYGEAQAIGRVTSVDGFVTGRDQMFGRIPSADVIASIQEQFSTASTIVVEFDRDPAGRDGLRWTAQSPGSGAVANGTPCDIEVILRQIRPVALILPGLDQGDGASP